MAAAVSKFLEYYKQGEFKESESGCYVNGRIAHDAFAFNKKKSELCLVHFCYFLFNLNLVPLPAKKSFKKC